MIFILKILLLLFVVWQCVLTAVNSEQNWQDDDYVSAVGNLLAFVVCAGAALVLLSELP